MLISTNQYKTINDDFIRNNHSKFDAKNWRNISIYTPLSEDIMLEFFDYLNWHGICSRMGIPETVINAKYDKLPWSLILRHTILSNDVIRNFINVYFNFYDLIKNQQLNDELVDTFFTSNINSNYNMEIFFEYQNSFSDSILIKYVNEIDWNELCYVYAEKNKSFSDQILDLYFDKLTWNYVICTQSIPSNALKRLFEQIMQQAQISIYQDTDNIDYHLFSNILKNQFCSIDFMNNYVIPIINLIKQFENEKTHHCTFNYPKNWKFIAKNQQLNYEFIINNLIDLTLHKSELLSNPNLILTDKERDSLESIITLTI